MYVLHQDRMTVAIFEILPTLQSHLLLPAAKLYNVFIDEVDHSIDDVEIDYRHESARLRSFKNWPVSYIRPETLAAAGFYFTGQGDTVKCFDCHTELCQWLKGDDPIMDHERLSPMCKYVNDTRRNVSTEERDRRRSMMLPSLDVCGIHDDAFGVFMSQMERAKHIYYSSYGNRLASFDSWDLRKRQTKEQLAQAGFFYTKNEDHTFCFYCGVDMYDWQPHEDPWEVHCYWMPDCHYLLSIKGHDYPEKFRRVYRYRANQTKRLKAASKKKVPLVISEADDELPKKQQHCLQKDIENVSKSVAALSIEERKPEKTGACASTRKSLRPDEEHMLCRICYNKTRDILFMSCNHIVACSVCAEKMDTCPVCRAFITSKFQVRYE